MIMLNKHSVDISVAEKQRSLIRTKFYILSSSFLLTLGSLSAFSSMAADAPTSQQSAKASSSNLEEVSVTARRKEESLQDTPVAISAMSGEALAASGINNVADLTKSVPSLEMANKGGSQAAPYIRGVGQRQNKPTLDPAIAIYMDDVYLGRPDGALMDIADIANLQVLRGPQGTLFGRNATGGAIVISPNKPTDEVEGLALARTGSFGRRDMQFALNTPITENFYTRLALGQSKDDGYKTNLTTGEDGFGNVNRQFLLAQARWLAGDYTTVDFNINVSAQNEKAGAQNCLLDPKLKGQPSFSDLTSSLGPLTLTGLAYGQNFIEACQKNEDLITNGDYDKFYASLDPLYKTKASGGALTISHEFEMFDFKSVTSYRQVSVETTLDLDATDLQLIDQDNVGRPTTTKQFTQEFNVSGAALEGDLDYTAGIYYWAEESKGGAELTQTGPMTLGGSGLPFFAVYRRDYLVRETKNESYAAFGQATYHATDNLDLTAGLRYTTETRGLTSTRLDNVPGEGSYWGSALSGLVSGDLAADGSPLGAFVELALNAFGGVALDNEQLGQNIAQIVANLEGSYIYIPLDPATWGDPNDWVVTAEQQIARGDEVASKTDENSFQAWTPMFNATYFFDDDWLDSIDADSGMMYFTWSKGFRAGGLVTENTVYDKETKKHVPTITKYDPEHVTNYEFGFKFDMHGNLRFNGALYYMDYTDQQATLVKQDAYDPLQIQAQLDNVGQSAIYGLELEATYLPTDNLDLSFNINLTEAKYETFDSSNYESCDVPLSGEIGTSDACGFFVQPESIIDRSDEEMPLVTPLKAFVSAQYRLYSPFAMITPRVEAVYKSGYHTHFDRGSWDLGLWEQEAYTLFNARVAFDFYDEKTRLSLAVENITEERPIVGGFPIVDTLGGGGVSYGPPRTWSAEIVHKF